MKRVYGFIVATCALVSLCQAVVPLEKLEEAIAQSRLSRVKALLNKVAQEKISDQARTKLLGNLYDMAAELTDKRIESLSLIGNWRDTAKTVTGTVATLGGIGGIIASLFFQADPAQHIQDRCFWGKIGGSALVVLGAGLFYKGFTCSTQKSMIAQATEVEEYIDSVLNNAELLEGDDTPSEL